MRGPALMIRVCRPSTGSSSLSPLRLRLCLVSSISAYRPPQRLHHRISLAPNVSRNIWCAWNTMWILALVASSSSSSRLLHFPIASIFASGFALFGRYNFEVTYLRCDVAGGFNTDISSLHLFCGLESSLLVASGWNGKIEIWSFTIHVTYAMARGCLCSEVYRFEIARSDLMSL